MRAYASLPHYRDHLEPVLSLVEDVDAAIVASYGDLRAARLADERRIVLMQHGIGQSYGDDRPHYPGGRDNDGVGLFLCPNRHSADRWKNAYPTARVRIVGSPRIEHLPLRESGYFDADDRPCVAISFHWNGFAIPESRSAFDFFRRVLPELHTEFRVIGHSHPRRVGMDKIYDRMGIEYVPTFDEVCRRADVYVADNTSTLYEFASTGRPVVVLNSPDYRLDVEHGLRFWEAAGVGINVFSPDSLVESVGWALQDDEYLKSRRGAALATVYEVSHGATEAAAEAIHAWAADVRAVA